MITKHLLLETARQLAEKQKEQGIKPTHRLISTKKGITIKRYKH